LADSELFLFSTTTKTMTTVLDDAQLEPLRYPVGRFTYPPSVSPSDAAGFIAQIAELPANMRNAVKGLDEQQLSTPYRPEGWTVRQVVHHVPDSHMMAFIRFKLALTENTPTILPYNQTKWANLPDVANTPVEVSLALLDSVHARWVQLLRAMSATDFACQYIHPEYGKTFRLDSVLAMYAWHSRHHVAQITGLRARMGW
jgi:hypothetical protein